MKEQAPQWVIERLEAYLHNCLNVEGSKCYTWWKHDECLALGIILYDFTGHDKYANEDMIRAYKQHLL